MRQSLLILIIACLVFQSGCTELERIISSYPGLTLYFERASTREPFEDVTSRVKDYPSAGVSGLDGKVTHTIPAQASTIPTQNEFWTLDPVVKRTKDITFYVQKGDNYFTVVLQDDPRQPYKLAAGAILQSDSTYIYIRTEQRKDGSYISFPVLVIPANVHEATVPRGIHYIEPYF